VEQRLEIVRGELIGTMVLSLRRHPCQLHSVINTLLSILGFNKNLLNLFMTNASFGDACLLST